jgi:hypothetical protein
VKFSAIRCRNTKSKSRVYAIRNRNTLAGDTVDVDEVEKSRNVLGSIQVKCRITVLVELESRLQSVTR